MLAQSSKRWNFSLLLKLKKRFRRLINRYYSTARLLYRSDLLKILRKKDVFVLVYQMGKVGSSSVVKSLKAKDIYSFNVHTFNRENLRRTEYQFKKLWVPNGPLPFTLWDQQFFARFIRKTKYKHRIKIITLIRDPVARNISHFFQYPNMILEQTPSGYYISSIRYGYEKLLTERSIPKELPKLYYKNMDNHDLPLLWFDKELKTNFGIDVFDCVFPKERGYKIYSNDRADVLLIKLEMLDKVFGQSFSDFLNVGAIELLHENIGSKKKSASLYRNFLSFFKLSDDYLDRFYNSKFVSHFYTIEEVELFRQKWRLKS